MKGDEAMRELEEAKQLKAGPMELAEKVDEVRKQIPHAFSFTLQDRVATNMDQNVWYDQKVQCVQCICIEHIELFGCMHEDKCKYAHTMPFEWEAASSKNNPGFDTSLRFLPS